MREHYLLVKKSKGCRGGIYNPNGEGFELEIGGNWNASPEIVAFAAHIDEVMEYLRGHPTPIATLLHQSIVEETKKLTSNLEESFENT
jgi:hypothetical protein